MRFSSGYFREMVKSRIIFYVLDLFKSIIDLILARQLWKILHKKMGKPGVSRILYLKKTTFIYLSDIPETFASGQLRLLHCLAPNWVYLARVDCSRGGGLLNRLFTLTAAVARGGGLFSVALSVCCRCRQHPIFSNGIPPCGVRTFLPPARGERMSLPRLPYVKSSHNIMSLASIFELIGYCERFAADSGRQAGSEPFSWEGCL